jgi:hypothetical protein
VEDVEEVQRKRKHVNRENENEIKRREERRNTQI